MTASDSAICVNPCARAGRLVVCALAMALGACASQSPATAPPTAHAPPMSDDGPAPPAPPFEQRWYENAVQQLHHGQLAEAALSFEILTVLRPDDASYRNHLAQTRRLIDARVAELLRRGSQASRRGAIDVAEKHYLAVLALQPDHGGAAEALRNLERERNRRSGFSKPARMAYFLRALACPGRSGALGVAAPQRI
jgi:hypothetical protein